MKIMTILGARPQFIKAGNVSREISKHQDIEEIIVHTGQHFDKNMSDIFFEQMQIPKPNYNLNISNLPHGAMTGKMIEEIEKILLYEKPDWVLVYGDTNSTLAGALAASKLHIKIAHVEAGLRSFNMNMPEEINRILTDRMSNILFCPTDTAVKNLENEGYFVEAKGFGKVVKVGDVMKDGAAFYSNIAVKPNIKLDNGFIVCTLHRAENTDNIDRLINIIDTLNEISKEMQIILPLHPRTKKTIQNLKLKTQNLKLLEPVGYLEMIYLLKNCSMVMTDSGGLQKEAYFFQRPCIALRDETEWIELVQNRFNVLAGADKKKILNNYKSFEFNNNFDTKLYGNGNASAAIVKYLKDFYDKQI